MNPRPTKNVLEYIYASEFLGSTFKSRLITLFCFVLCKKIMLTSRRPTRRSSPCYPRAAIPGFTSPWWAFVLASFDDYNPRARVSFPVSRVRAKVYFTRWLCSCMEISKPKNTNLFLDFRGSRLKRRRRQILFKYSWFISLLACSSCHYPAGDGHEHSARPQINDEPSTYACLRPAAVPAELRRKGRRFPLK